MPSLRRLLLCAALPGALAACQDPRVAALSFSPSSWVAQAQLDPSAVDRWVLTVAAQDLTEPLTATAEPTAETLSLEVPPGPARLIRVEGQRDEADLAVTWPVYAGEQTADLVEGPNSLEVAVAVYGLVEGTLTLTDPVPLQPTLDVTLSGTGAFGGAPVEGILGFAAGAAVHPLVAGVYQAAPVSIGAEPLAWVSDLISVDAGVRTRVDLLLYRDPDKCRAHQPGSVWGLPPVCLAQAVAVSGLQGTGLQLQSAGGEVLTVDVDGVHPFADGVRDGDTYGLSIAAQPTGGPEVCAVTAGAAGLVQGAPVLCSVDCTVPVFALGGEVRGVPAGSTVTLTDTVSGASQDVFGDGPFSLGSFPVGTSYAIVGTQTGGAAAVACTANRGAGVVGAAPVTDVLVLCLGDVQPLYSTASDWNTWVSPLDLPCDEFDSTGCVHAGELRRIDAGSAGLTSCAGLSAIDGLGALRWTCDDGGGRPIVSSVGIEPGMRLEDLLDVTAGTFRPDYLELTQGADTVRTPISAWWSNPVRRNVGVATAANEVLVIDGAYTGGPVQVVRPIGTTVGGITVVVVGGAALLGPTPLQVSSQDDPSLLGFWFEGTIAAAAGGPALDISRGDRTTLRNASITGGDGVRVMDSSYVRLEQVAISGSTSDGFNAVFTDHVAASGLTVSGCGGRCIFLDPGLPDGDFADVHVYGCADGLVIQGHRPSIDGIVSAFNLGQGISLGSNGGVLGARLHAARVFANGLNGIRMEFATNAALVDVVTVGNGANGTVESEGHGLSVVNGYYLVVVGMLAADNRDGGINLGYAGERAQWVTLHNVAAVNNGTGLLSALSADVRLINTAFLDNDLGLYVETSEPFALEGVFLHGGNATDCYVDNSTTPALGLQANPICTPAPPSDVVVDAAGTAVASFLGKAADAAVADPAGRSTGDLAAGIVDFESEYRTWIADPSNVAYPSPEHRTLCTGSVPCQVFDWRLNDVDSVLRQVAVVPRAGDQITMNWNSAQIPGMGLPLDDANCSAYAFLGSRFDGSFCVSTFALNAMELPGAGPGNALCEVGESCVEARNLGAYQGSGPLVPLGPRPVGLGTYDLYGYTVTGEAAGSTF